MIYFNVNYELFYSILFYVFSVIMLICIGEETINTF